jgi:phage tail-like protein
MTCGGGKPTFRLLDSIVGWDVGSTANHAQGLSGFTDQAGVTLSSTDPRAVGTDPLAPYLPPPWLGAGCGPCEWYLATPARRTERRRHASLLLRLEACHCDWRPVWAEHCTTLPDADISAIAVSGQRVAVADRASARILLIEGPGNRVMAEIPLSDVVAMTFAAHGVLVVAQRNSIELLRFGPAGTALAPFAPQLPKEVHSVARMGAGSDGSLWLAARGTMPDTYHLWRARFGDTKFLAGTLSALAAVRARTDLARATAQCFCIARVQSDGVAQCCYSRLGEPIDPSTPASVSGAPYEKRGQLLSGPIDSGIPRCVWHRVRMDADVPVGTTLAVAVATSETIDAEQTAADPAWPHFPPGVPHPADWQKVSAGSTDFLIRQPPGRYLYVRMRLESRDGVSTPRVRRMRLDFPRATSIDLLPAIYRQESDAADFTERFVALFDANIADLDAAIERAPALLDVGGVPDDVLSWLGRFLGLALDPAWEPERRRAILHAIPELYRRRGTLGGLKLAFRLVFDVEPAIEEFGLARSWAAFDRRSAVGAVRLFGRRRARAQLGRSALGATQLKSYGNPALDPLEALAYRFRVLIPPSVGGRTIPFNRLHGLIESQKPAHTIASLRVGGYGFILGARSAIGIDTAFVPPPAPILGRAGNIRLNRLTVLRRRPGSGRRRTELAVGMQPLTE